MLLQPRFKKFKKMHKGNISKLKSTQIKFFSKNSTALQAIDSGYITVSQIEAARKVITRKIRRLGKLYIHIFPNHSLTARAKESRMGSGKGSVDTWVSIVRANMLLFEVVTHTDISIKNILYTASWKLPLRTKILYNNKIIL